MPRFAANLSMMFTEVPFLDRFDAAAKAIASQAAAMCTPASSWLIILKAAPCPAASPSS